MRNPLVSRLISRRPLRGLQVGLIAMVVGAAVACDSDPELCRFDPFCGGGLGGFCHHDGDCHQNYCCTTANCGGGMCTLPCRHDHDCPFEMACEHDVCFFMCDNDADCAPGMSCKHSNTICEWD